MDHQYYEDKDFRDDPDLTTTLAKMVVEGGLGICKVCGLYEGSLTTECPGVSSYPEYAERVYRGEIDFVGGEWTESCSPHTPAYYRDPK